ECARIDEVKDIRDKAMALEMYHRQAQNFEAEREAANVRLRAERRVGELLKELARAPTPNPNGIGGKSRKIVTSEVVTQQSQYAEALESNGISRQKAHRYQRLADVPAEVFEDALAGPEKPTTTRVAALAKVRVAADPVPDFSMQALWLWGRLRDLENKGYFSISPGNLFDGMTDAMAGDVQRLVPLAIGFLETLENAHEPA
ncbi:MAG: hypothetical protein LBV29_01145, partial [Azoarcus sp.]|nr:hypothetical protein [Azoarcus sp.]